MVMVLVTWRQIIMKRIDIQGMGVFVECYKRKEELTDTEMLKEAAKAITREVMRREAVNAPHTNNNLPG